MRRKITTITMLIGLATLFCAQQTVPECPVDVQAIIDMIKGGQTGGAKLVINEIMYNPNVVSDSVGEYIELYNDGNKEVDVTGWTISDTATATAPQALELDNPVIKAGEYRLLVKSLDPTVNCEMDMANGKFSFTLDNSYNSELGYINMITVKDAAGEVVDEVGYSDRDTWPTCGEGVSLERVNDTTWQCTKETVAYCELDTEKNFGTPGAANSK